MGCMLEVTRAASHSQSRSPALHVLGLGIVLCPRNHVIKGPSCVARPERPLPSCWELCGAYRSHEAEREECGPLRTERLPGRPHGLPAHLGGCRDSADPQWRWPKVLVCPQRQPAVLL